MLINTNKICDIIKSKTKNIKNIKNIISLVSVKLLVEESKLK